MEGLTPSLRLVLVLRETLERGDSVRNGLREYIQTDPSAFARELALWLVERDAGRQRLFEKSLTTSEKFLVRVVDRGLRGEAIIHVLKELEIEIIDRCESQMDEFIEILPLKSLMPLLLFIFPAYLILLLGPLVARMAESLQ